MCGSGSPDATLVAGSCCAGRCPERVSAALIHWELRPNWVRFVILAVGSLAPGPGPVFFDNLALFRSGCRFQPSMRRICSLPVFAVFVFVTRACHLFGKQSLLLLQAPYAKAPEDIQTA
jgi:hypothetical protein